MNKLVLDQVLLECKQFVAARAFESFLDFVGLHVSFQTVLGFENCLTREKVALKLFRFNCHQTYTNYLLNINNKLL